MAQSRWIRLSSAALALSLGLAGCGKKDTEEDNKPAQLGPVPLKQRSSQERAKRLAEGALDLVRLQTEVASAEEGNALLVPLFIDYLSDPPKGTERPEEYYERLCAGPWKATCDTTFPESYQNVALQNLLDAMLAEKEVLGEKIAISGLSEKQVALLQDQKVLEEFRKTISIPKADRAPFVFVAHPVKKPSRESSILIGVVLTDKGEVFAYANGNKQGGKALTTLPTAPNAPGNKPATAPLSEVLAGLRGEWEERAKLEEKALAEGKAPPPGEKLARPFDSYIEISVQPGVPAWYLAWVLSAIDEAGFTNPILNVRSAGPVPRLGMIPFPLGRTINKVATIKVKKAGAEAPKEPLTQDTLAKLLPEDGMTAQELANAIDTLNGCKEDPCGSGYSTFTVARWDD